MKPRNKRIILWVVILFTALALMGWIAPRVLTSYLENKIRDRIYSHNGMVEQVRVNLFARSIYLSDLEWSSVPESLNSIPDILWIHSVAVKGISLYQLTFNKTIRIREIVLDSGTVQPNSAIKRISETLESDFRRFKTPSIVLNAIEVNIMTDTIESLTARFDLHLSDVEVRFDTTNALQYSIKHYEGTARGIQLSRHEGMYGGTIKKLSFSTSKGTIAFDSLLLIPNYSKYRFAQVLGEQAGRVNISIPSLTLEGVAFDKIPDSSFIVSRIVIQSPELFSFKDKRLPFLRDFTIPLPMEGFINAKWNIRIDTLQLLDALITIEEYPEEGDERTRIIFSDVNASLTGLNNRAEKKDASYAILKATGLLMGHGKIKAEFQLPLDGKSRYTAQGTVVNFDLVKLNPVFVPIANIRIESGHLNTLSFNFNYTEVVSKGQLALDYEGLKLLVLKKDSPKTSTAKSFILNLFVKKNRNQTALDSKAVGVIDIERDRKRLIFNVWWQSILDGLKSSMAGGEKRAKGE
jgi:hypothetical protein